MNYELFLFSLAFNYLNILMNKCSFNWVLFFFNNREIRAEIVEFYFQPKSNMKNINVSHLSDGKRFSNWNVCPQINKTFKEIIIDMVLIICMRGQPRRRAFLKMLHM